MPLTNLIQELKVKSGRYDLSNSDLTAALNAGSKILDNLNSSINQSKRYYFLLESGEYIITLPLNIRYCEAVSAISGTTFTQLVKMDFNDLRVNVREATSTDGVPLYYTLTNALLADAGEGGDLDFPYDLDALTLDPSSAYRYVIVYPTPTEQTSIEVLGIFHSPELSDLVPDNKWSIVRPDVLMQAAMYYLTKDLLNIDESAKQLADLKLEVTHLIYDSYAEQDINEMEG